MVDETRIAIGAALFVAPFLLLALLFLLGRFTPWRWPQRLLKAKTNAWAQQAMILPFTLTMIAGATLLAPAFRYSADFRFWTGAVFAVFILAVFIALERRSRKVEGRFFETRKNGPEA